MTFNWVTFAFQVINVLVLLVVLWRFLFRPVAKVIAERQAQTQAALKRAEAARVEAEAAEKAAEAAKQQTEAARHDVLEKARDEADAERRAMLDAARAEAATVTEAARNDAKSMLAAEQAQTLTRARDLGETIARRALSALPNPPDAAGYATRLGKALAAMPEDQRRALWSGRRLRLVAPQPLTDAERAAVRASLSLPADIEVEVDPKLVAGLELRSDAGFVHNSLAHDLDQIALALKSEPSP